MRSKIARLVGFIFAVAIPTVATAETVTFGEEPLGALPKDFDHGVAGVGGSGRWEVVRDATATGGKALAQLGTDASEHRFLTAFYKPFSAANVEVTVQFKPVAGKIDQAGGVVARLIDAKNYYIARANALEDNVRFYRVKGDQRQQLATADAKVLPGTWHTLTLRVQGDQFSVLFDGKLMHTTTDKTIFPRPAAGRVGAWTKSDSITYFDRIEITPLP